MDRHTGLYRWSSEQRLEGLGSPVLKSGQWLLTLSKPQPAPKITPAGSVHKKPDL